MHIEELVEELKNNSKKYIIDEDVEYVTNFIAGYIGELGIQNKRIELDHLYHGYFNKWVEKWIRKKYDSNFETNHIYWYKTLNLIIPDKKQAYDLFFVIIEDFFEAYHQGRLFD